MKKIITTQIISLQNFNFHSDKLNKISSYICD